MEQLMTMRRWEISQNGKLKDDDCYVAPAVYGDLNIKNIEQYFLKIPFIQNQHLDMIKI